jgi:hypothetical protein
MLLDRRTVHSLAQKLIEDVAGKENKKESVKKQINLNKTKFFMKKNLIMIVSLLIIIIPFDACKKDKDTKTVTGYWKGQYGTQGNFTDMSWLIMENNTLRVYFGPDTTVAKKADGTYTKTDSTISAEYQLPSIAFRSYLTGKLNADYTRIEGADNLGLGIFFLTK